MPLQFIDIPEPIFNDLSRYCADVANHSHMLTVYGSRASTLPAEAESAIALGCEVQKPEHLSLTLPVSFAQFDRAIQTLLQASQPSTCPLWNDWQLDLSAKRLIHPQAETIHLTDKEALLLSNLMQSVEMIDRQTLLEAVWGYDEMIDTRTLETHIYRLRQKVETINPPAGCGVITEAKGYRWIS